MYLTPNVNWQALNSSFGAVRDIATTRVCELMLTCPSYSTLLPVASPDREHIVQPVICHSCRTAVTWRARARRVCHWSQWRNREWHI
jgi:hypothetical protein